MVERIQSHRELRVFKNAFQQAMKIFNVSKSFPKEETYALTDQVRRSSRSICANLAEAWRKRRYEKSFISKLSDSEAEAAETQVWLEFALECGYIKETEFSNFYQAYEKVISQLVKMINDSQKWTIPYE